MFCLYYLSESVFLDNFVGFTAYITSDVTTSASQPVIFDSVYLNIGSGYNPVSGLFTCPVSGIYAFSVSMLVVYQRQFISLQLVQVIGFNEEISYTRAHGDNYDWNSGSLFAIIECEYENVVYVRANARGVLVYDYTSFSGYLLKLA